MDDAEVVSMAKRLGHTLSTLQEEFGPGYNFRDTFSDLRSFLEDLLRAIPKELYPTKEWHQAILRLYRLE